MADILIENGRILTSAGWSERGYLTVQAGKIAAIGTGPVPPEIGQSAGQVISAGGMAVLPGLTNAHTHLSQSFMRGLSAGRPLLSWLKELIWPLEAAMTLEELKLAALLGLVENLRFGATHVVDHQKVTHSLDHSLAVGAAAEQCGLRLTLARAWADQGSGAGDPKAILDELEALFELYSGNPLIDILSGPLTIWRARAETLQKAHALARSHGSGTHMHVSETRDEVGLTLEETGLRPIARLDELGVLDEMFQIVHGVWLDPEEIRLVHERRSTVIHCPVSNAVLGSGTAPIHDLLQAGVPIWLGSDGPASNDNQDLFEAMKIALCSARTRALDPAALSPADVVRMATGGKTLEPGAPADLILVDLHTTHSIPTRDIDSALALCCQGGDVDTVMVGGRLLLHKRQVLVLDEPALLEECERAAANLRKRAGIS